MFIPEDISKRAEKQSTAFMIFTPPLLSAMLWNITTTHKMPYLEDFLIWSSYPYRLV